MKKAVLFVLVCLMTLSMTGCISLFAKRTDSRFREALPRELQDIQENDAYGDFGKIRKNVNGEGVDINGDEEKRSLRPSLDEDAQDEEIRWGDFVDWIRRSNQD